MLWKNKPVTFFEHDVVGASLSKNPIEIDFCIFFFIRSKNIQTLVHEFPPFVVLITTEFPLSIRKT